MIAMDDMPFRLACKVLFLREGHPIPRLVDRVGIEQMVKETTEAGYACWVAHPVGIKRNAAGKPLWVDWAWYDALPEDELDASEPGDPIPDPPNDEHPQEELGIFEVWPFFPRNNQPNILVAPDEYPGTLPTVIGGTAYATFPSWLPDAMLEFTKNYRVYKITSGPQGGIGEPGPSFVKHPNRPAFLWLSDQAKQDEKQRDGMKDICAATGVSGHQAMCRTCGRISKKRAMFLRRRRGWDPNFEQFICTCP